MSRTVIALAAGISSRYGGVKQLERFGRDRRILLAHTLQMAIVHGFSRAVCVIREEMRGPMEAELCHLREFIEIDYAVQRVDDVPSGVFIPVERKKPWGTAHAVFVARNFVRGSFLTVNGDDYYAPGVWECLDEVLAQHQDASAMVAHRLSATLPDSGPVSRGICEFAEGYVRKIREFSTIARAENQRAVDARTGTIFHADVPVSMNFFYLQPSVLHLFSAEARAFFAQPDDVLLDAEWQLPAVIDALLQKRKMILRGVVADCPWCGLTHARDREALEKFLDESSSKPNLRS